MSGWVLSWHQRHYPVHVWFSWVFEWGKVKQLMVGETLSLLLLLIQASGLIEVQQDIRLMNLSYLMCWGTCKPKGGGEALLITSQTSLIGILVGPRLMVRVGWGSLGCNGMRFARYDNHLWKYQDFTVYGIT